MDTKALVMSLHDIADSVLATINLIQQQQAAPLNESNFEHETFTDGEAAMSPLVSAPSTQRVVPWGGTVSPEFMLSCIWIENQIGLKPENLLPCMKFESNINPAAKNPYSSGSGLIQFMESTAKRLGTTTAALRSMSAVTQLSYVYRYFKEYADRGFDLSRWSLEDTYMAILWPAAIGKPETYRVFVDDPNKLKDAYDVNKGLDANKDGFITKQEACARVVKLAYEGSAPEYAGFI